MRNLDRDYRSIALVCAAIIAVVIAWIVTSGCAIKAMPPIITQVPAFTVFRTDPGTIHTMGLAVGRPGARALWFPTLRTIWIADGDYDALGHEVAHAMGESLGEK
jgi:hypothetical protein